MRGFLWNEGNYVTNVFDDIATQFKQRSSNNEVDNYHSMTVNPNTTVNELMCQFSEHFPFLRLALYEGNGAKKRTATENDYAIKNGKIGTDKSQKLLIYFKK